MPTVDVIIPTIRGREAYLERCLRGYRETCPEGFELNLVRIRDEGTCGIAWQKGCEWAVGDYLHLTSDDIVPMAGWLEPLVEACDQGKIPCALVVIPTPELLDEDEMPRPDLEAPPEQRHFFERHPSDESVVPDWYECREPSEYPSIPFMTSGQWEKIGPMIASNYGGDRWIGHRAKQNGMPVVARHGSRFVHYAATEGKVNRSNGWMHCDRLDFDLAIAWHEYTSGRLAPTDRHPLDLTPQGREIARSWRRGNLPPPHPWELEPDAAYK